MQDNKHLDIRRQFYLRMADIVSKNADTAYTFMGVVCDTVSITDLPTKFNTDYTVEQISGCKRGRKIKSGYIHLEGLNKPVPIGAEEIHNGYLRVKIGNPSVWRNKGIIVWEKVHGKIPKDHIISYLDGNPANADINNLCLISKADQGRLTRFGKITVMQNYSKQK